jgi:hypothetical protein
MVIGLVLHSSHRARFAEAAGTLTGVLLAWAVYEREDEIPDRVARLVRTQPLDGLLLGPLPYARCLDLLPAGLPVAVTRSAALDLALAWARARGNGWPATPVSIDSFDHEIVDEVATALDLDRAGIAVLPFDPGQTAADVVEFHLDHLARTGARYVISVRTGVAAGLDGRTAVVNAMATTGTIRTDLHQLVLRIRQQRADGQRFAAAVLRQADNARSAGSGAPSDLHRRLAQTPELADAWIEDRGPRGAVLFAPAATFEALTRRWTTMPTLGGPVSAGFGIGSSALRCVGLAEQAAGRAEQETDCCAYLLTEEGVMIGPMGPSGAPLAYTYREHGNLEALADLAGLSPATLSRLAAIERSLAGRPVSPGDLARTLGITDPSGRRLIRKLSDSRLAVEEGSTQPHRKGRPARLYRLAITPAMEAIPDLAAGSRAERDGGRSRSVPMGDFAYPTRSDEIQYVRDEEPGTVRAPGAVS